MGAVKNHAMGIEEDIFAIPNLETKGGECEVVQEFQDFVIKALYLKTHCDISCAKESATELWNEFWGKYY